MWKWSGTAALIGLVLLANVSAQQSGRGKSQEPHGNGRAESYVSGELLVRFSPTLNAAQKNSILSNQRATRLRRFEALDLDLVRVPPGQAVAASVGGFKGHQGVAFAQPNYLRYAIQSAPPNDPLWLDSQLWGLDKIQAQPVWTNFTRGDGSVVVASIDSGANYLHPDLASNMWRNPLEIPNNGLDDDANGYVDDVYGIDTLDRDSDPMDVNGHGTLTAGIIAAAGNNGVGGTGVNWNAKILPCRFLDADGIGTDAGAIECFDYIVALRNRGVNIRVSSNGWGADRNGTGFASALQAAIDAAGAAGIVNIFGAGNDGRDTDATPFDPASFASPSIVAVASSGRSDARSTFTNYGAASVDLAAPGENIVSTSRDGDYAKFSGTSAAAAHAAGVAALVSNLDPTLTVTGVKALLLDNVDRLPAWAGRVASGGRLNAYRAAVATGVGPNKPPTVSITSPAEGTVFETPANLMIEATASDTDGTIQHVEFFVNGASVGVDTTAPYIQAWSTTTVGAYVLTAVATDSMDAVANSAGVTIQIKAPNVAPSVAITSPIPGASFVAPAAINLTANASDSDGTIASVTFYADGAPIGVDSAAPYALTWNTTSVGNHVITAVAIDNRDATTTSAGVSIQVQMPNVGPTVTLTSPAPGASFVAPAAISLTADATDSDGAIASVTFYVDGVPIGTDNVSPYGVVWNGAAAGSFTLSASATDSSGATTVSNVAVISISIVQPRMNVARASNGGVASASSTLTSNHPASGAINGDRRGVGWGSGGGWNDGTQNATPDWLMVEFNGPKTIDEVSVFSMQDNFTNPIEPTATQTFTTWGLRGFEIQYWTGSDWATVPGTTVTTNNLVWRRFAITPITTTRIRVFITAPLSGYSRVIEVEAWGVAANPPIVAWLRPAGDPLARWRSMLH